MKFDKYSIKAKIAPAVISLVPFLIFTIRCNIDSLSSFFSDLMEVKLVGNITISIVLLFLLVQITRALGKFIFENSIFNNELEMPTTKFLLFSDLTYSNEHKLKIRNQIKSDFDIELPNESDETTNLADAQQRIVEAVGLIRSKVKNGRLLLQHNIDYGFWRNLIGGALIGLPVSIFDIIYFFIKKDALIGGVSIVSAIFFLLLLLLRKPIINRLGIQYAKRLYVEYLQK